MRIVALVPGGIGKQLLFFPTLDSLKQAYPEAQIDVIVEPGAQKAYSICQSVRETLTFSYEDRKSLADWGNLLGLIRDREYDVAIYAGQGLGIRFALWLSGIPVRIGYGGGQGEGLLTQTIPLNSNQYAAHTYHDLLQGLGIDQPCPDLSVKVPAKSLDWADAERQRLGIQNSGYVLIAGGMGQGSSSQAYPLESWKGIIQDFEHRQPDLPIVLLQGAGNSDWVKELTSAFPKLKVTAPDDIGKTIAMIAGASLMLAVEGDAMHLAVATKTYVLALFGPTMPEKLLPKDKRFVGIKSLTGQMADISPQMVLEKVWGG
jgi:ADP-heptose:LPS heptosyltransferase